MCVCVCVSTNLIRYFSKLHAILRCSFPSRDVPNLGLSPKFQVTVGVVVSIENSGADGLKFDVKLIPSSVSTSRDNFQ